MLRARTAQVGHDDPLQGLAGSGEFVYLTAADIVASHQGADRVGSTLDELVDRGQYGFLGLPSDKVPSLAREIRPSGRPLDPHVEARVPKIRQRTRSFSERFGYG